jgi:acyl carrier protein
MSNSKVIVVSDELVKDGNGFLWSNASQCVTYFDSTPSLLRALMGEKVFGESPIEVATVGAEALDVSVVESFSRVLPHSKLVNAYGPTEAAIGVTFAQMSKQMATTPIGGPVYNTKLSLLLGELLIGGIQVGHGYVNLPGKTASSFVAGKNDREYQSGDLVRQDATGDFHYLRRKGMQVKVRGFRVELGEIESVGMTVDSIVDFAVVGVPDASGRVIGLVGFYVGKGGTASLDVQGHLDEALSASLPPYMVPTRYVRLDALPNNSSMKVDRKQLVLLATSSKASEQTARTPTSAKASAHVASTSRFTRLKAAWVHALSASDEQLTQSSSFFDVGGDSISAIRLVSAIKKEFPDAAFTVKDVFEYPTIEAMATRLGLDEVALMGGIGEDCAVDEVVVPTEVISTPDLEKLREVWRDVLKVEFIDNDASFFVIGGDSISAIRLVSGVRAAFLDTRLTVKDVFDHPSILQMAGFLGLKSVKRENVEKARTTMQTRDVIVLLRNKAR